MKKTVLLLAMIFIFSLAQSQPEPSSPWLTTGNSGTNPLFNFLGTTDNRPLRFRVVNMYAGEIDSLAGRTNFGYGAGSNMTTAGAHNVAIGFKAMFSTTNGFSNTAVGYLALSDNVGGCYNTATGNFALYHNVASGNTATGRSALVNNTGGGNNTGTGLQSLSTNTTGSYNTASGASALGGNSTGSSNTADGVQALYGNTTGSNNTAVGYSALSKNTAAQFNTAMGLGAGSSYIPGWNNTMLGAYCDMNTTGLYNCIAIGEQVTCTAPSQARIGNSSTVSIGGYVSWSNISDGRYKKDIQQNVKGLDFILKLQPVTYHLDVSGINKKLEGNRKIPINEFNEKANAEKEKMLFSGFVAQDVEKAAKEIGYDFSGIDKPKNENDLYGLRYAEFVVPLVKSVQELSVQNTALKNELEEVKKNSADQKKINEDLLERLKRLESSFVTKNNK
jgi:hypothetical protein